VRDNPESSRVTTPLVMRAWLPPSGKSSCSASSLQLGRVCHGDFAGPQIAERSPFSESADSPRFNKLVLQSASKKRKYAKNGNIPILRQPHFRSEMCSPGVGWWTTSEREAVSLPKEILNGSSRVAAIDQSWATPVLPAVPKKWYGLTFN